MVPHIPVLVCLLRCQQQVKVFCRDLISSTEITATVSKLGEYELHDLIQLE